METEDGLCHMNMEFTLGLPPQAAYDVLTNPDNQSFARIIKGRHELLVLFFLIMHCVIQMSIITIFECVCFFFFTKGNVSRKVLTDNGTRQMVEADKTLAWSFLSWSGTIPISLIFVENHKNLSVRIKLLFISHENQSFCSVLEKFMSRLLSAGSIYMNFEGSWKVEPIYVDSERLCKHMKPKSREEYQKCSCGQGKIASKVTINQNFQPSSLLNLPPLSWSIRNHQDHQGSDR